MTRWTGPAVAAAAGLLVLAGCAPPPAPVVGEVPPPDLHAAWYRQAAQAGRRVYAIDTGRSTAWVVVRRGGPLAGLGHDHVVASHSLEGYLAWPGEGTRGRADIRVALDRLEVDPEDLRRREGLDGRLDADAVAGTARNMHDRVLESSRFPFLTLRLRGVSEPAPGVLESQLTLHGITRLAMLEVTAEPQEDALRLSGRFRLRQTDFGITPFSVLGGALRVKDELEGRFTVVARAWPGSSPRFSPGRAGSAVGAGQGGR